MSRFFSARSLVAMIFILAGVLLLRETYAERVVFYTSPDELGPMTYPRYLLWGWLVLSVLYLILPARPFKFAAIIPCLPSLFLAAAAIGAYYLLFKYTGLFISTALFMVLFLGVLQYRDPKRMAALALSTAFIVWVVFEKLLAVPMPAGILQKLLG